LIFIVRYGAIKPERVISEPLLVEKYACDNICKDWWGWFYGWLGGGFCSGRPSAVRAR
jgi:hypothetical protein